MTNLVPCPSCNRHVRVADTCPFCGAEAPKHAPRVPRLRASGRMAILFAGSIGLATACAEEVPAPLAPTEAPSIDPAPTEEPLQPIAPTQTAEPTPSPEPIEPDEVEVPPGEPGEPLPERRASRRRRVPEPITAPVPAYGAPARPDPSMVGAYGGPSTDEW